MSTPGHDPHAARAMTLLRKRRRPTPGAAVRLWATGILSALVIAGVVFVLIANRDDIPALWERVRDAPPWLTALLFILPIVNWLIVSAAFWFPSRTRTGDDGTPVGPGEMVALIGMAWLVNHVPLRPGMVGRVAYHKRYNAISLRSSAVVLALNGILSLVAMILQGAMVGAVSVLSDEPRPALCWTLLAISPFAGAAVALLARSAGWKHWDALAVLALRLADFAVWVLRYQVLFAIADQTLTPVQAVALGVISQVVLILPFAGNGAGAREGVVGFVAVRMGLDASDASAFSGAAITLDIIHRAAEFLIAIPVGIGSLIYLDRAMARHERARRDRRRARRRARTASDQTPPDPPTPPAVPPTVHPPTA